MMNSNSPTPKSKGRNRPLLVFVILAVLVVAVGYWYQLQHATPIATSPTSAMVDSLNLQREAAGEAFLAAKAKEAGVESLGGGILYKVIKQGAGEQPTDGCNVKVHYEGRLADGTVFDSSYERGEPASFPLGGVVKGWQVALKAMKVGDVWEVYLPHYMGYGETGSGANIPPYAVLVFKMELLAVEW